MSLFHTQRQVIKPEPNKELNAVELAEVTRLRALASLPDGYEGRHTVAWLQDRLDTYRDLPRYNPALSIERNALDNSNTDGAIYELKKILQTIKDGNQLAAQIAKGEE